MLATRLLRLGIRSALSPTRCPYIPEKTGTCPPSTSAPGLSINYEDDCFAAPWTTPETVVLVHGNSESSRAWTQWVPYLAGTYR